MPKKIPDYLFVQNTAHQATGMPGLVETKLVKNNVGVSSYSNSDDGQTNGFGKFVAATTIAVGATLFGGGISGEVIGKFRAMLTKTDELELLKTGMDPNQVAKDMAVISGGKVFAQISEPATLANGRINVISETDFPFLISEAERWIMPHLLKFVPASGAATRMFKDLNAVYGKYSMLAEVNGRLDELSKLEKKSKEVDEEINTLKAFKKFWEQIRTYPFYAELSKVMLDKGKDLESVIRKEDVKTVLKYLLTPEGLNYSGKPKLALTFHLDNGAPRTAMEEQVKEAVWLSGGKVHFTVSPDFYEKAHVMADELTEAYAAKGVIVNISFSTQAPVTDTIAMKPDGSGPFRTADDKLYFRQSGHGALLPNLNEAATKYPFVLIQNVDNLPGGSTDIIAWKMAFLGHFARMQREIYGLANVLLRVKLNEEALAIAFTKVSYDFKRPVDIRAYTAASMMDRQRMLFEAIDRPFVLSAMVPNEGEPGGGPFSVVDPNTGFATNQIVEGSQINKSDPQQKAQLEKSTHFNPVFLVVGTRDFMGRPFDLEKYALREGSAVFVVDKNHPQTGEPFKSLDTGLWNGCIGNCLQLFVEMPGETFGPAKTVLDLSPENRPFRGGNPYGDIIDFKFSTPLGMGSSFVGGLLKTVQKSADADRVPEAIKFAEGFAQTGPKSYLKVPQAVKDVVELAKKGGK